ncbi:Tellurium resistance [Streptomyces somaliensis DSM 40738]|uniref:Tellurium resistance n=1 Tax=Streptomyces somaliensis (strain ATCC 33201 / DSM 40738 / JCM 12659 / KCTC 9044 / NCTC 11332 / NRRL B-12077 / IP 733) TaxID=1134445 RepID=A0AA44DBL1_STRE0|nr:Tellurium resistance [Streptomyces somaliensis]MCP9960882.1 Tellurium resistance [Streptomyces somaliensis]MCP9973670.1 Tellurium resistance [Streptomyces somaliensis]MCQ0022568.1 Tellurium resistance [Streptomyces somaliensis DSM 40738]NKY13458.1 Tellurium resistance [Streptomyces somaliensis DSM 40738]
MAFWNILRRDRTAQFDSGGVAAHVIGLTQRRPTVSLTKQGAATGNLRVNLSWKMRTSDFASRPRWSERLLRDPLKFFQPEPVQAHTRAVTNVDLDIGCLYELADGTKGVVQPLGGYFGDLNDPPYVKLSGDDRFGSPSGETIFVNLDHRDDIRRLLFFVYIYDQTPAFDRTHAMMTLYPSNGPRIEIELDERAPEARSCAVFLLENVKGELLVRREAKFVYGFQGELDRMYGWGMQWGRGFKAETP